MKGWDGATRKSRDTAIVCGSNKNSVPRVLKPSDIRRRVEDVLMHVLAGALLLAFPDGTVRDTARFVMKASATGGSLTSARRHARNGHSRRQMARVVEALEQGRLQRLITHSLRKQASPFIPEGRCTVAVDIHLVPYYGRRECTGQLITSKARQGTDRFHGYSTIYAAVSNRRITFGMRAVRGKKMLPLLRKHLDDARACNVRIGTLLLDREFYSMDVITFLRSRRIPFIMPVRAGRKMAAGWNSGMHSFTTVHALKSGVESIDLRVQVAKRREHRRIRSYYFAVYRVCTSPRQTMQLYRRRFGIESSYRIAETARARTSSRETAVRLLNMFVAVLIENEWVIAKMLYASNRHRGSPVVFDELIRFRQLLLMIVCSINKIYGESQIVENRGPPPSEISRLLGVPS